MKKILLNNTLEEIAKTTNSTYQVDAATTLLKTGIPHTKQENWKYTNFSKYLPETWSFTNEPTSFSSSLRETEFNDYERIVFEDGFINKGLSTSSAQLNEIVDEKEITMILSEFAQDQTDFFEALSRLSSKKLYTLTVPKSTQQNPIAIHHTYSVNAEGRWSQPVILIQAAELSESVFVEYFHDKENPSPTLMNSHLLFDVEKGAKLEHVRIQVEDTSSVHFSKTRANVARDARFHTFTMALGGQVARQNILVNINGENSESHVHGFFGMRDEQHNDIYSDISHNVGHNESHQLVKGILDDNARGVFTGRIVIQRDAQLVDSSQINKNILLGTKSHMDTRPQLEVYADDVKCAHGATIGQIDPEEVFYLQSRGIKLEEAQKILCHAFAYDTLDKIQNEDVKAKVESLLFEKFEKYALEHFNKDEA